MPKRDLGGALVVGAGPAGLAPLVWAARTGALSALAERGLAVVDAQAEPGAGAIGDYRIDSDTAAATFLECLADGAAPRLMALRDHPAARRVAAHGHGAAPLVEVAAFLRELGRTMIATLRDHGVPVIAGRAMASRRTAEGWETEVDGTDGLWLFASRALVLATGAVQNEHCLDGVNVGDVVLRDLGDRVMLSGDALGLGGAEKMRAWLTGRADPRVVIVGGSHSALAVAWRVLHELPGIEFDRGTVMIVHRRPLRPFYLTPKDARADGFHDFSDEDICPVSGRVFRLAGFRFRARELVRQALRLGDTAPEPRLTLLRIVPDDVADAEARLRSADLVIAALGYRPLALPLFDSTGNRIVSAPEHRPGAPLVNDGCEMLDAAGVAVPQIYALGLAAGFRPSGALGGEPSFKGQTNGLWLWQNGVGERIVQRLLSGH